MTGDAYKEYLQSLPTGVYLTPLSEDDKLMHCAYLLDIEDDIGKRREMCGLFKKTFG